MIDPRISLEQWRSLLAVGMPGAMRQAAEALHKSQSAGPMPCRRLKRYSR